MKKRTVLITGCSDGRLGSALALKLHAYGQYHVFATARNESKLDAVKAAGIETSILDVSSEESLKASATRLKDLPDGSLDILVNNAGAQYMDSITEGSIAKGKQLFDVNVWSIVTVTQAFLPLLLRSQTPIIVNHTSILSMISPPFVGFYSASKAAASALTISLRSEISPFGVQVVELRSGKVKSHLNDNGLEHKPLLKTSLFWPAREQVDPLLNGEGFEDGSISSNEWSDKVATALSRGKAPNTRCFGGQAFLVWFAATFLSTSILRGMVESAVKFHKVKNSIAKYGMEKRIKNAYGSL